MYLYWLFIFLNKVIIIRIGIIITSIRIIIKFLTAGRMWYYFGATLFCSANITHYSINFGNSSSLLKKKKKKKKAKLHTYNHRQFELGLFDCCICRMQCPQGKQWLRTQWMSKGVWLQQTNDWNEPCAETLLACSSSSNRRMKGFGSKILWNSLRSSYLGNHSM